MRAKNNKVPSLFHSNKLAYEVRVRTEAEEITHENFSAEEGLIKSERIQSYIYYRCSRNASKIPDSGQKFLTGDCGPSFLQLGKNEALHQKSLGLVCARVRVQTRESFGVK